jgi:hypothetical protein
MFANTVAVAGGVGRVDAAAPVVAEDAVGDETDELEELGLDVAACADVAELFCAPGLPPQPTKYVAVANTNPTRMLLNIALLNKNLLTGS